MIKECDNIAYVHQPRGCGEDDNAGRWICERCWNVYVLRKDWRGVYENREYSKIFKQAVLQGSDNLFYKYYEQFLAK